MDMAFFLGLQVIYIKEIMRLIFGQDMGRCTGKMAVITKDTGIKESSMVKEIFLYQDKVIKREYSRIMFL